METGWITYIRADGLVRRVVPDSEILVLQCLIAGDASRGIKVEHLGEQIERERVRMREQLRERHTGPDGQRTDVVLRLIVNSLSQKKMRESATATFSGRRRTLGEPTRRRVSSEGVPR